VSLFVIDASIAAKWFLPARGETLVEEASVLLTRYAQDKVRFLVPDLFWAEFANVLWKAARQGRCSKKVAAEAVTAMRERGLPTVPTPALMDDAFSIAAKFDRTVYDSLYVALAVVSKAQLVTADEKLANALAAYFPVKWLGSLVT
jgi:predicted nucleic acid-binding protein